MIHRANLIQTSNPIIIQVVRSFDNPNGYEGKEIPYAYGNESAESDQCTEETYMALTSLAMAKPIINYDCNKGIFEKFKE